MSHNTLYIDIDEEITSIIDRVRKSQGSDIIIVAPKQALLLQSLVNLKLLKKEADRKKKKIIVVTQDRIGKKLIEKAGIIARGKVEDSAREYAETDLNSHPLAKPKISDQEIVENLKEEEELIIGSEKYFDEKTVDSENKNEPEKIVGEIIFDQEENKTPISPERKKTIKGDHIIKMSDIVSKAKPKKIPKAKERTIKSSAQKPLSPANKSQRVGYYSEKMDKKAEFFFQDTNAQKSYLQTETIKEKKEEENQKKKKIVRKPLKLLISIAAILLVLGIAGGVLLYLQKASVTIYLNDQSGTLDVNLEAATGTNFINKEKNSIPAKLEQITLDVADDFEATGLKPGGAKAYGKVVIYNEYNSDDQPLVATTRLETADGKIFRLIKGVIVPGLTKIGQEIKPGAIEVEVAADKEGEDYNIDASTFKIPGFKDGPKYEKFYAKSVKKMEGGSMNETKIVTAQDISSAKEKMKEKSKDEAIQKVRESLPQERMFFDEAIQVETISSSSSVGVGVQAEKFSLTSKIRIKTLSFSKDDVKEILRNAESQKKEVGENISYVPGEYSLENGTLKFEATTNTISGDNFDLENFRKGILGKNSAELESMTKSYPAIKKIDVNIQPFFMTRLPLDENRVNIELR